MRIYLLRIGRKKDRIAAFTGMLCFCHFKTILPGFSKSFSTQPTDIQGHDHPPLWPPHPDDCDQKVAESSNEAIHFEVARKCRYSAWRILVGIDLPRVNKFVK